MQLFHTLKEASRGKQAPPAAQREARSSDRCSARDAVQEAIRGDSFLSSSDHSRTSHESLGGNKKEGSFLLKISIRSNPKKEPCFPGPENRTGMRLAGSGQE